MYGGKVRNLLNPCRILYTWQSTINAQRVLQSLVCHQICETRTDCHLAHSQKLIKGRQQSVGTIIAKGDGVDQD